MQQEDLTPFLFSKGSVAVKNKQLVVRVQQMLEDPANSAPVFDAFRCVLEAQAAAGNGGDSDDAEGELPPPSVP
jgi:hypothetical protein